MCTKWGKILVLKQLNVGKNSVILPIYTNILRDRAQPGLRYVQANAILENMLLGGKFQKLSLMERQHILEILLIEIRGRMMEEYLKSL